MAHTYKLKNRYNLPSAFTDASLVELDEAIYKLDECMKTVVAPHQPSALKTVKYHSQSHLTSDIRAVGKPAEFTSGPFEAEHVRIKRHHQHNSRKRRNDQTLREIVKRQRINAVLEQAGTADAITDQEKRVYATAWMRAAASGRHEFQSKCLPVSLACLASSTGAPNGPYTAASANTIATRSAALVAASPELR